MNHDETAALGPILFARGADDTACRLTAVVITAGERAAPLLQPMGGAAVDPAELPAIDGYRAWQYNFALPAAPDAHYVCDGQRYDVVADARDDLRIAYVSCNGQEHGDTDRDLAERNEMWRRLTAEHDRAPFALLLQGGDQIYADEALNAHPELRRWQALPADERHTVAFTEEVERAAARFYFERYVELYRAPGVAALLARVPSVMMWDDHDIMDGWGSHPEPVLDSPVGQGVFRVARHLFALFQLGCMHDALPECCAATDAPHFGMDLRYPHVHIVVPDLRSQRRPQRVMDEDAWRYLETALGGGEAVGRAIVMSSVPALGPRLSLLERLIGFAPRIRKYTDDLRDQWQSYAHREEWRRLLRALIAASNNGSPPPIVVSGEIHLATRGTLALAGQRPLHQLVASGITHPQPPNAFARGLGWLAALGEDPLPEHPIRMHALPGQRRTYTAERNYLVLERTDSTWTASWELEESGRTPLLSV